LPPEKTNPARKKHTRNAWPLKLNLIPVKVYFEITQNSLHSRKKLTFPNDR
jgi:hypothetical protein